jgi:5'-nucleotidase
MRRILVTNDDGVHAPGLAALAEALRDLAEVTVVAPAHETSAVGHAITLARPLRLEEIGGRVYCVDGTPTDCVNVAVTHVLLGVPDLIVSGINTGWNIGDDVTYSGTVAGALEGALLGIPSIAVSTERKRHSPHEVAYDFPPAAEAARLVVEAVLERGMPKSILLNVNVPFGPNKGFRVTVQGKRNHMAEVSDRRDPRGRRYFWIDEGQNRWEPHDRSDYQAVRDGYVSITPLQPDLTAHDALDYVEQLPFATPEPVT